MKLTIYDDYLNELCQFYVKKKDRVFDCGCGDGFHTSIIQRYSPYVIGGDFEDRTKKKYGINFRKFTVNKFGKTGEFDVVTSLDVIEHVEEDVSYLEELIRITKRKGLIIIGTPNRNRLSNLVTALTRGKIRYPRRVGYDYGSGGDLFHLREYTMSDLCHLVRETGKTKVIKTYSSFLGFYIPKKGLIGFRALDVKLFKNYCQHLFIVLRKI